MKKRSKRIEYINKKSKLKFLSLYQLFSYKINGLHHNIMHESLTSIPFNKYDKVVLKLLSHSFAWVEFHELGGYCQKDYYD